MRERARARAREKQKQLTEQNATSKGQQGVLGQSDLRMDKFAGDLGAKEVNEKRV